MIGHAFAEEQGDSVLLLSGLYVLPARQRHGVGAELLHAIVRRHPGTERVKLIVEARNANVITFHGRHGFVVQGEVEDEGEPCPLRMEMDVIE